MNLMASILDRSIRVARAADASVGVGDMMSLLRHRMPEVQTLLGLRDKLGGSFVSISVTSDTVKNTQGHGDVESGGRANAGQQQQQQREDKRISLRWRLLSLLDRYAQVIPGAVSAARFDFLKLLPPPLSPSAAGIGETQAGAEVGSLASMHPLVQLATLRLLAREGIVASQSGGGRSGWFTVKTGTGGTTGHAGSGTSGNGGGTGDFSLEAKQKEAENTPLGAVLQVSLNSPSPVIRSAARALAIRALQTLGVVTAPVPIPSESRHFSGGGSDKAAAEGEAGVWLDLLRSTPGAVGALVLLAKEACGDAAHSLMAEGIRAAETAMKGKPFLTSSTSFEKRLEGDWEVEFRYVIDQSMHLDGLRTTIILCTVRRLFGILGLGRVSYVFML